MASLYSISARYMELRDAVYDASDDDGEIPVEFAELLSSIDDSFDEKVVNCCRVMRDFEHAAAGYKIEAARLQKRQLMIEKAEKRLKQYVIEEMQKVGKLKVDGVPGCRIAKNSQPSCAVIDEKAIPRTFFVEREPELSRSAVVEEWKRTGEQVPGTETRTGVHLRLT